MLSAQKESGRASQRAYLNGALENEKREGHPSRENPVQRLEAAEESVPRAGQWGCWPRGHVRAWWELERQVGKGPEGVRTVRVLSWRQWGDIDIFSLDRAMTDENWLWEVAWAGGWRLGCGWEHGAP